MRSKNSSQAIVRAVALALACPALLCATVASQKAKKTPVEKILGKSENVAFIDVDVYTGDGKKLEKVTVLVEDGKIQKIGKNLAVPRSARRVEGGFLTPGWVLVGSQAGVSGGSRRSAPSGNVIVIRGRRIRMGGMRSRSGGSAAFTPNVKVSDRIDINSKAFADWLEVGVTTHGIRPAGSGMTGLGEATKAYAEDKASMILADETFSWLGMVSSTKGKKTVTDGFKKAKELIEARKKPKAAPKTAPKPAPKSGAQGKAPAKPATRKPAPKKEDPRYATLAKSLEGKLKVMLGINGLKDLLHAEHALKDVEVPLIVFHPFRRGAGDTLEQLIPLLKKRKATVVCPAELGTKPATAVMTNPIARLQAAGIPVVLTPPGTSPSAAKSVWIRLGELLRAGAKPEKLIESMTLAPAKLLGVDKKVGSIAKDKDANFLHFSRNPFSPASRLLNVYFEGRKVENAKARSGS